jgi:hypothetical protein
MCWTHYDNLGFVSCSYAFTDKVESNCHFPNTGWNCTAHCQALQGFPDTSHLETTLTNRNKDDVIWVFLDLNTNDNVELATVVNILPI